MREEKEDERGGGKETPWRGRCEGLQRRDKRRVTASEERKKEEEEGKGGQWRGRRERIRKV